MPLCHRAPAVNAPTQRAAVYLDGKPLRPARLPPDRLEHYEICSHGEIVDSIDGHSSQADGEKASRLLAVASGYPANPPTRTWWWHVGIDKPATKNPASWCCEPI